MSKVSGRTGPSFGKEQACRPDERALKKRAFEKRTLPEPPRLKRPKTYLLGRSPLRAFYYTKGARGKWHTARRVTDGTGWNAFLCSGTAIPKGTAPAIYQAPPAVKGLLSSVKTAKETSFSSGHTAHHEVHAAAMPAHIVETHTMHFHQTSGTGWVDVPMPGMQTQYQQGLFVHLDIATHHHHHGNHAQAAQEQQVPLMSVSMVVAAPVEIAPAAEAKPQAATAFQIEEPARHETNGHMPRAQIAEIKPNPAVADSEQGCMTPINHVHAPASVRPGEPLRLHFSEVRAERRQNDTHTIKTTPERPAPRQFHSEIPRSEEIRKAPEPEIQATAPPAVYCAQHVRAADIPVSTHIGYIPSVKKKEIQLKVAQGAEAVPPQ